MVCTHQSYLRTEMWVPALHWNSPVHLRIPHLPLGSSINRRFLLDVKLSNKGKRKGKVMIEGRREDGGERKKEIAESVRKRGKESRQQNPSHE